MLNQILCIEISSTIGEVCSSSVRSMDGAPIIRRPTGFFSPPIPVSDFVFDPISIRDTFGTGTPLLMIYLDLVDFISY